MSKKKLVFALSALLLFLIGIVLLFCAGLSAESGNVRVVAGFGLGGTACCVPYMVYMR